MNLSRNFTLQELIKSDTAIRLDINNNPNSGQIEKLKALCENILQPVRDHFGRVKVTSGFRSEQLCLKIGSSVNSQHAKAEAADFECMGTDNAELADWIYANLNFDQLIKFHELNEIPIPDIELNKRRLMRNIESFMLEESKYVFPEVNLPKDKVGVFWNHPNHKNNIEIRTKKMIDNGLVEEINKINNPSKTVLQAIGMNLSDNLEENINISRKIDLEI